MGDESPLIALQTNSCEENVYEVIYALRLCELIKTEFNTSISEMSHS